jgi:3-mercaptopyruvate sulfurtransferase SseA
MRYLLVLTIFALGVLTACQQAGTQTTGNQAKKTNTTPVKTPEEAKRITLKEAKAAYDAGTAFIVDTRDPAAYKNERIKGSVSIPAGEVENRVGELPKDKLIIFYCS